MPDRDHTQRRVFRVIAFHERKRALCEQSFARLILVHKRGQKFDTTHMSNSGRG